MGLDVMFYTDAKPYQCPCLKKVDDIQAYWEREGTRMAAKLEFVHSNERSDYSPITFECYDLDECLEHSCVCKKNVSLKAIDVGRISHYDHDGVFKPGQVIEYKESDGFYFGSIGKTRRIEEIVDNECKKRNIADPMSEMNWVEGFYTGQFLYWFKRQLAEIVHLDSQLEVYKKLLETVSDEDLITKCVVVHC